MAGDASTVVDADGTEYLDALTGLWYVNTGYGRSSYRQLASRAVSLSCKPLAGQKHPRRPSRP